LRDARVVLGVVAPMPWQVDGADASLEGRELTDALADQAADRLLEKATPLAHNAYKVPMARALVRRALQSLTA
jgi:xanthine dehydrogenase YagS FAD-binding subunit